MSKKKYLARNGAPFRKSKAQEIGEVLEKISSDNNGKLTPELVVESSKQKGSPIGIYFEWDDKKASNNWRIQQAKNLINHVVEVIRIEGKLSEQRSFFNVTNGQGRRVYVTIKKAIAVKSYRIQLLSQLIQIMTNATELLKMFKSQE